MYSFVWKSVWEEAHVVLNLCTRTWFTQYYYGDFVVVVVVVVVSLLYTENHVFQLMLVKACKLYSMPVEFVLLFIFHV